MGGGGSKQGTLLKKHFLERRLFNLYWKLVKAGYVE